MAVNFFSRSTQDSSREPVETVPETPSAPSDHVVQEWRAQLRLLTSQEGGNSFPSLTVSEAHPGGLAQLYAGRPTKLSSLIRESAAHKRALERARSLVSFAHEMAMRHGVAPVHIAIGHAQWGSGEAKQSAPVFLRPLRLAVEGDDVVITLRHGMELSAAFEDALADKGVRIDMDEVAHLSTQTHGFSASVVLDHARRAASVLENFDVREELTIGIFEHPAALLLRELDHPAVLMKNRVIRALAGDAAARSAISGPLPQSNPNDRDPDEERGAGDLTPRQQDVVEAVAEGHSFIVDTPSGADDASLISAIIADSAANGRTLVHIAGSPSRALAVHGRLRELGIDEAAVRIDGSNATDALLGEKLLHAAEDTNSVEDTAEVAQMRARLRTIRQTLSSYTTYLHRPFKNFGVSAFNALQVLTDLTATKPAPRTRVRLGEDVLLEIASDQGERARELLHEASALGVFSRQAQVGPWKGIVIGSQEQVPDVLERVDRLAKETLPQLRVIMSSVAGESGITPAVDMRQWYAQLSMFEGVREVLDIFQPRVFERSAADMVIATASKKWRQEHGISMSRSQRVRLVKQAQDMLRPGTHVNDLHRALLTVQERRDVWRQHCDSDGWPTLPSNLTQAVELTQDVAEDLEHLTPMFATAHGDLEAMPIAELAKLCERLSADPEGGYELPRRVAVLKALSELGLEPLTRDLRQRHVADDQLDAELDLAWWASILGLMLATDSRLGGFDPAVLEQTLIEGRDLDRRQVASLVPQVISRLHRVRTQALADDPQALRALELAVQDQHPLTSLYAQFPLSWKLIPAVLTVPTLVPQILPEQQQVDVVILDGIDELPIAELVPIISRASQVVVFADLAQEHSEDAVEALAEVLPQVRMDVRPTRLNDQMALLLARYRVDHTGVPVPWTSASAPVTAVWTEGTGMPTPGSEAVESTSVEVDAVVEAVLEHATSTPDRSLAVVALNAQHAERIRAQLTRTIGAEPGLASFFDPARVEPFVVVDPDGARGLGRDHVIISVGFAKTPHGRVIHHFGVFSSPAGAGAMADVLRSVRGDLTVVSSIRPEEIDTSRLSQRGALMLVDLLEIAQGQSGVGIDAWPTLEIEPDRLLIDLADRLYGLGLEVVANIGIPGGLRIPLAIGHPEVPGRLLLAVLTDDDEYVAQPSLRVRDRLWPSMLEEQGWKVHIALSMAVFIDPAKETDRIVQLVLDAVDEINGPAAPVLELPEDPDAEFGVAEEEDAFASVSAEAPHGDQEDDEASQARQRRDELVEDTRENEAVAEAENDADSARGERPAIARGLPLAAYSDDQLDEVALWVASDGVERSEEEAVDELWRALGLTRRGAQTDAVLRHVIRRNSK